MLQFPPRSMPGLLTLVLFLSLASTAMAQDLLLGVSAEPDSANIRMARLLCEELGRRTGNTFEAIPLPSDRVVIMALDGELDGDLGRVLDVPEYEGVMIPVPEPLISMSVHVYTLDPDIAPHSIAELARYRVIYPAKYRYTRDIVAQLPEDVLVQAPTRLNAFRMLAGGRGDLLVCDAMSTTTILNRPEFQGLEFHQVQPPLLRASMHIHLNIRHASLVPVIDQALREMKADGSILRIRQQIMDELTGDQNQPTDPQPTG